MRKIIAVCFFVLIGHLSFAQDTIALKKLVVNIKVTTIKGKLANVIGTGFIIGRAKDSIYIATAGHVLENVNREDPILVAVPGISAPLNAKICFYYYRYELKKADLGILRIAAPPGFEFTLGTVHDLLDEFTSVFFIRENLPGRPTTIEEAPFLLKNWYDKQGVYFIHMANMDGGESGGPVFTKTVPAKLVGMILRGANTSVVLHADEIKVLVNQHLKGAWQWK